MPANVSASSNDSRSPPSSDRFNLDCLYFKTTSSVFLAFTIKQILLVLPLCSLVLYRGLQRWWKQRTTSTAATSHSDCFTYHLSVMELIHVLGSILGCYGIYSKNNSMLTLWFSLSCFLWYGETFFHVLTCVEHYLAIVHPITYLSLKQKRAIQIRDVSMGCVWLVCVGWTLILLLYDTLVNDLFILIVSTIVIFYCNLSVLCVLIRPGPGHQGSGSGERVGVDQSKQRAFNTSLAILGILLLRCVWNLVWTVLFVLNVELDQCVWLTTDVWMNLPDSLVLPLLFLHRAGMLVCCRNNVKRDQEPKGFLS